MIGNIVIHKEQFIKFKILLVDDDLDLLEVLSDVMKFNGYEVTLATGGLEAISILKQKEIQLIVSDYRMPNGDGSSILNFVNAMKTKPVFFFFTSEDSAGNTLSVGKSNFFLKPFSFNKLITAISEEHLKSLAFGG